MGSIFSKVKVGSNNNVNKEKQPNQDGNDSNNNKEKQIKQDSTTMLWSKTAGSTSGTTVLVNQTNKTLYLRDKVGSSYGQIRYVIPALKEMKVTPQRHTFYRMLVYAVLEEEEPSTSSSDSTDGHSRKDETIDTKLTINSDQLADCKRIVISMNTDSNKYVLQEK